MLQIADSVIGREAIYDNAQVFLDAFELRRHRSIRQFAEEEIVLSSGPYAGRKFACDRQPMARVWLDLLSELAPDGAAAFSECVITGGSQSGKTLIGFTIPVMYHLFEIGETVVAAVPDDATMRDKWERDLLPIISRSRYRRLLPTKGAGSHGGLSTMMTFANGAVLRWMTATGSDKTRANFTTRVICYTETDGFDSIASTSAETNKIKQIEARARSYAMRQRRIYKECTVTTRDGHTWQRYQQGTATKLMTPCRHCGKHVALEREHLVGHEAASSEVEAGAASHFVCVSCGERWSEEDRQWSQHRMRAVHRGQEVTPDGEVVGAVPATYTLGFRWSAVNNLLVPAHDLGVDEYRARHAADQDDAEREMSQFVWCVPYQSDLSESEELTDAHVVRHAVAYGRGVVPPGTQWVTVGCDVNRSVLHWTAIAWRGNGSAHIIDYGTKGVRVREMAFEQAIVRALRELRAVMSATWSKQQIDRVCVDCRYETKSVIAALRQLNDRRWGPYMGLGVGHLKKTTYTHPDRVDKRTVWAGTNCYERFSQTHATRMLFGDSNWWKSWLHSRFRIECHNPDETFGAMTIYGSADEGAHQAFARHITSEREVVTFERGKGHVRRYEPLRSANHWLDSTYMACVAANRLGWVLESRKTQRQKPAPVQAVAKSDGVEFGESMI